MYVVQKKMLRLQNVLYMSSMFPNGTKSAANDFILHLYETAQHIIWKGL